MKKLKIQLFLLLVPVLMLSGQDSIMMSKKGIPILPQAGDWAIGIDARPFTQIFNSDSDIGYEFMNDNTLIGKKFITANMAHRFKLRLAFYSLSDDEYVMQDGQVVPDPLITVTDTRLNNYTYITVGYGIEKRSGYGRLQALYGGEFLVGYDQMSTSYTYGNGFSVDNPSPTTYNFGGNIYETGKRVVYNEPGYTLEFALRAFLGIEYFIAPKIAVGGEFGWGIAYDYQKEGKEKVESYDGANNVVKDEIHKTGGSKDLGFDNDNFGGLIYLIFHFK